MWVALSLFEENLEKKSLCGTTKVSPLGMLEPITFFVFLMIFWRPII